MATSCTHRGTTEQLRRVLLLVCAISALMGVLAADAQTHIQDRDCEDFDTQTAAQNHADTHLGDPDHLDPDFDGIVCLELPCPCGSTMSPPGPSNPARAVGPTAPIPAAALPSGLEPTKAQVVSVIDGSTLKVRLPTQKLVKVRLIGIDTPDGRARGEWGARQAADHMKSLAFRRGHGRTVSLRPDPAQDRVDMFDRLLVYIDASGTDFGRKMISSGWAKTYAVNGDFQRLTTYRNAEASAKAAKRGLWRAFNVNS